VRDPRERLREEATDLQLVWNVVDDELVPLREGVRQLLGVMGDPESP
jgi:uncharacterized protein with HEPN domain